MELYETIVLWYLTKDAHTFVSPQYSIRGDHGREWSCPDFVSLNFCTKTVSIVEVSTAYDPAALIRKVQNRDNQWIARLKDQLMRNRVVDETWKDYRVHVFVRRGAAEQLQAAIAGAQDVQITMLDDLPPPWEWSRTYDCPPA